MIIWKNMLSNPIKWLCLEEEEEHTHRERERERARKWFES